MWKVTRDDKKIANETWYEDGFSYLCAREDRDDGNDDGEVVCHAAFYIEDDCMYLYALETKPEFRNKKAASTVMSALISHAMEYGVTGIVVHALAEEASAAYATTLLIRFGFEVPTSGEKLVEVKVSELKKARIASINSSVPAGMEIKEVRSEDVPGLLSCMEELTDGSTLKGRLDGRLSLSAKVSNKQTFVLYSRDDEGILLEALYLDPGMDPRAVVAVLAHSFRKIVETCSGNEILQMCLINQQSEALCRKLLEGAEYSVYDLLDSCLVI